MSRNKIVTIVLILFLIGILLVVIRYSSNNNGLLVTPWVGKIISTPTTVPTPAPIPATPSYNPPKEFHYGSATNLKEELNSINLQVLDSDFE